MCHKQVGRGDNFNGYYIKYYRSLWLDILLMDCVTIRIYTLIYLLYKTIQWLLKGNQDH